MGQKLTDGQLAVLALLSDVHGGEALEPYIKGMSGSSRASITSLWHRDMLSRRNVANGVAWSITDAGRAALSSASKPGER